MSPSKTKAGAWKRVSTLMQDAENQVPDIEGHCRSRDYEIVKWYSLEGGSAFHGKQEKLLAEALADVRSGDIEVLVGWASDRMERRGSEATLKLIREFRKASGQLEFVKEEFLNQADAGTGELLGSVIGWTNKQESTRKRERQLMEAENKANGGIAPKNPAYGYKRLPDGRQIPDGLKIETLELRGSPPPDDMLKENSPAWVVREVFRRYANGEGCYVIAADLNRRNIPTRRRKNAAKAWTRDSVGKMLRVRTYAAIRTHQGQMHRLPDGKVPNWPPLVDLDLWWSVQGRIETRKDENGKLYRSSNGPYMMAATARCYKCGGRLECLPRYNKRTKVRNGQQYQCHGCGAVSIEQLELDEYVTDKIVLWCIDPKNYTYLTAAKGNQEAAKFRARAREKQKEMDATQGEYDRGEVPGKMAWPKMQRLERERDEAEQAAKDAGLPAVLKNVIGPRAASKWVHLSVQQKREVIRMVAEVTVHPAGYGNQFRKVEARERCSWRWLIGPEANKPAVIPAGREYATPRDEYRAALISDPALARLNHKAISVKLGTSGDTIKYACQSLVADGTFSECPHRFTESGQMRGQRLAVKGGSIRAALLEDAALAKLNHTAIARRLGMAPKNVMRACQTMREDGTIMECPHVLNEDGSMFRRAKVLRDKAANSPKPPSQTAKPPTPGARAAARRLILDFPDMATLSHGKLGEMLGVSRYNVQRACFELRAEGRLNACTHAAR